MKLRYILADWAPPVLKRVAKRFRRDRIIFYGQFENWVDAEAKCSGYQEKNIAEKVLEATLKVKSGEAAFERDSVVFDRIEYSWPATAALMWACVKSGSRLNVLDYGGALGSHYHQNRKFLECVGDVRWSIVEQPEFVECGKKHLEDDVVKFYKSVSDCIEENSPNVIFLSSVLQYLENPFLVIDELLSLGIENIIIDRVPYRNVSGRSIIKIQNVPESIYKAAYPCWFFIEAEIVKRIEDKGYFLVESFCSLDKLDESADWKGHIFSRKSYG